MPFAGVRIKGARIVDDVDLENAKLIRRIEIANSRIEGAINLRRTRTDSLIMLDGSLVNGAFAADGLHSENDLFLGNGVVFKSDVTLNGAKIDGFLNMPGASFEDSLDATALQVGGSLLMFSNDQNKASFKGVILRGATIKGQIAMAGASFDGNLDANSLQVGGSLFMRSDPFADDATGSRNKATFKASFKDVDLRGATINEQLDMAGASFDCKLLADFLQVGGHLVMRDADFAHEVVMPFSHVGGNLDLRGATLAGLNLSNASIARDLRLGGAYKSAPWKGKNGELGTLTLRNAHIGNLTDAKDAWPARGHLHLDGFSFNHLGGFAGETEPKMRTRGMEWWDTWARRDPEYSPAPYAQLAAALTNAGDRDAANEILTSAACGSARRKRDWPTFGLDSFNMSPASVSARTPSGFSIGWSASPSPVRRSSG